MRYSEKQFIKDVVKEATLIRENATPEEKNRLDFSTFDSDQPQHCIYGQLAEHCRSDRAIELIQKCCPRYVKNIIDHGSIIEGFKEVKRLVNGTTNSSPKDYSYLSSIETYILLQGSKNEDLIKYIKGEASSIEL